MGGDFSWGGAYCPSMPLSMLGFQELAGLETSLTLDKHPWVQSMGICSGSDPWIRFYILDQVLYPGSDSISWIRIMIHKIYTVLKALQMYDVRHIEYQYQYIVCMFYVLCL